jgi:hypothetical protein
VYSISDFTAVDLFDAGEAGHQSNNDRRDNVVM